MTRLYEQVRYDGLGGCLGGSSGSNKPGGLDEEKRLSDGRRGHDNRTDNGWKVSSWRAF